MIGVIGIIAVLTVLGLSLVITKVATIALTLTGLSEDSASFQSRSAFTGTGFTTRESEKIVTHPVRRKIIMLLMILRSAGIVTIIISLILTFVETGGVGRITRLGWLIAGVLMLFILSQSKLVNRSLSYLMNKALEHWTELDTRDYASLLRLSGDYTITNLRIEKEDWVADKKIKDCDLSQEGLIILGINREKGDYVGAPRADTEIYPGDTLLIYGREDALNNLDKRKAGLTGEKQHHEAMEKQKQYEKEQQEEEEQYKEKRKKNSE